MDKKHYSIRVTGKVQGVFFRASTVDQAKSFGLMGFVKNASDGSVYIEVEGGEEELRSFVKWCNVGPPSASVEECLVSEGPLKNFSRFEIHR